jgi:hypothetical protein
MVMAFYGLHQVNVKNVSTEKVFFEKNVVMKIPNLLKLFIYLPSYLKGTKNY